MKKVLTFISLFILIRSALSQGDSLNQYNIKGKKQGYWLCYLDEKFIATDSTKGKYVAFDYYDNGQNLTKIGQIRSNSLVFKIKDSIELLKYKGTKYVILNGRISFYNKKNFLIIVEYYKKGSPYKHFCFNDDLSLGKSCEGTYTQIIDYSRKLNDIIGTYYYEYRFCPTQKVEKYWFRKGKRKWKLHRIKEEGK